MARNPFHLGSKTAFDVPLAGFAAAAVAFVAWVMPEWRFQQLVELSGLPSLLSAAQPPLGGTARAGVAAAGALAAFLAALLLLRIADRFGKARPERDDFVLDFDGDEAPPPRLRRFDVHPDAPARRPICAARDFGEPEQEQEAEPEEAAKAEADAAAPLPFWHPEDFPAVEAEEAERWENERDAVAADEPPAEIAAPAQRAEIVAPPAEADAPLDLEPESIAELMARLERGLSERGRRADGGAVEERAPEPVQVFPEAPAEDRLRSAIESLQRMTARTS